MTFAIKNPDSPATSKQTWAIKCLGGGDVRDMNLTRQQASDMIASLKANKPEKKNNDVNFQKLWDAAKSAGLEAGDNVIPTPMVVSEHVNPLNDNSPVKNSYYVSEGACGFAWVNFKMKSGLNRQFGRWLIKNNHARKDDYQGGVTIWISEHGQSIERKSAHARALASYLNNNGIKDAFPYSRMD